MIQILTKPFEMHSDSVAEAENVIYSGVLATFSYWLYAKNSTEKGFWGGKG